MICVCFLNILSLQLLLWELAVFPDLTNSIVLQENNLYNYTVIAINDNVYYESL